jgi:hypothetical protein
MNCSGNRDITRSRPSETIKLVDDDVVDLMLSQAHEHPLKSRAIGVLSRLAAVDEFGHDKRPQPVRRMLVGISCGCDREAV